MLNVSVVDHVSPWLVNMEHNLDSIPLEQIAAIMLDSVMENFQAGGRPEAWAPRVEPTGDWPLLIKSGDLLNSFWQEIDQETHTIYMDSGVDYSDYLNQGTSKMVARPFLLLQPEDEDQIYDLVNSYMESI